MRIGLKLWSSNTDFYLREAAELFKDGWFNYIELCVVPRTEKTLRLWMELKDRYGIPFTLHAPHSALGVNLADSSNAENNRNAYKEVEAFRRGLSAEYTVVHAGVGGDISETLSQLKIIRPKDILIENKPFKTIDGDPICRGATVEELKMVIYGYGCGFCLDIGHAVCSANSQRIDSENFLKELRYLNPRCYHLSDNDWGSEIDRHMHIGQGNYNFEKIFRYLDKNADIAIETSKDSKTDLNDFVEDVKRLREIKSNRAKLR